MDTSETYVKMCERAWKLQVNKVPDGQDDLFRALPYSFMDSNGSWWWRQVGKDTQLFRQDQLQEMVEKNPTPRLLVRLVYFLGWDGAIFTHGIQSFVSYEQLWLAFVMKEQYGKVWDGENWVIGE